MEAGLLPTHAVAAGQLMRKFGRALLAAPSDCKVDLVLARHYENTSWTRPLHEIGVCVHVYRTAGTIEVDEIAVPNTGREALCFLQHLLRVFTEALQPAPLTVFAQGMPHCAWDSTGHPLCIREYVEYLRMLTEDDVESRGGVVLVRF